MCGCVNEPNDIFCIYRCSLKDEVGGEGGGVGGEEEGGGGRERWEEFWAAPKTSSSQLPNRKKVEFY